VSAKVFDELQAKYCPAGQYYEHEHDSDQANRDGFLLDFSLLSDFFRSTVSS